MAIDKDKQLNDYLAGRDGLSSLYGRTGSEEPSSAVDKALLDAAADIEPKKRRGTGPFSGNWFMPVALAAVLVLAVGITLTLERPVHVEPYQADRYLSTETTPAGDDSDRKVNKESLKKMEKLLTAPRLQEQQKTDDRASRERQPQPVPQAPAQPAKSGISEPAAESESKSTPLPADKFEAGDSVQSPAAGNAMDAAPAAAEPEPPTPTQSAPAGLMRQQLEEAKPADQPGLVEPQTAERWLQSIRELMAQNKIDEARQQLADFHRVYPDYPLGEEFSSLIK